MPAGMLLWIGSLLTAASQESLRPPSAMEAGRLLERYFEAEPAEREQIGARLDLLPPLTAKDLKDWREKKLPKLARKQGTKIERSGEAYFYDEEEKRGRYIVRGDGKKGLMIGLHGGGAGSGDASSAAGAFQSAASDQGWISIYPEVLEKTEHGWTDSGTEEFVLELIEAALCTFDVDCDRIYLAGHSMGGYGTWTLGAHHVDRFAGLAAYAGAPTPYWNDKKEVVGIEDGVLPNLRNVPFHIYQSRDDPQVPFDVNHFAAQALEKEREKYGGFRFVYQEVDGRGHGFPEGGPGPALEWIAASPRDPRPRKVVWEPCLSWIRQLYWLRWEKPQKGAVIVAEVKEPNVIEVTTTKPCPGLKVLLDERVADLSKPVTVRLNGQEVWSAPLSPRRSVLLRHAAETLDPGRWYLAEVQLD